MTLYAVSTDASESGDVRFGIKFRAGGRYDNVRMCVASDAGVKGGPAADISAFADLPAGAGKYVHIDLPVMRPILFAAAFRMLQFEPTVTLLFNGGADRSGWVGGPALGVSLHYGPDYISGGAGSEKRDSFFAAGPIIGAFAGYHFRRPDEKYDLRVGITPYVTPLFGIKDPDSHRGVVVGGLLDGMLGFNRGK
jgi:hypothetical protein